MKKEVLTVLIILALVVLLFNPNITGEAKYKFRAPRQIQKYVPPAIQKYVSTPSTTISQLQANQNPIGWFDTADCGFLSGWTCDPDNYANAVNISLYEGDTVVAKVIANRQRESAVAQACGNNANHGFFIGTPTSLKDSKQHTIVAKAIDANTGVQIPLSGNPKTLTCSPGSMICGGACNNGVCPAEFRGGCSNGVCVDQICTEDDQSVSYKGPGCSNGADDDADGKIDCQDSGCSTYSNCQGQAEFTAAGNCADKIDNDADGKIDCQDTGCLNALNCLSSQAHCFKISSTGIVTCSSFTCKATSDCIGLGYGYNCGYAACHEFL